jgi:4-phytase/acid phosphatase
MRYPMFRSLVAGILCLLLLQATDAAQTSAAKAPQQLQYVVIISRHGVRSPTSNNAQLNVWSASPWPTWDVAPGILTPHGFDLMRIFGVYDRKYFSSLGLLSASGCSDANRVTVVADSDQRTRETGRALAEGIYPGCAPQIHALSEGVPDILFHSLEAGAAHPDSALAVAAIAGRMGGSAENLTATNHALLQQLDTVLAGCRTTKVQHTSIFSVPASLGPGKGDHLAELRGPLLTASSLTENFLLEYTQGMSTHDVAWGCVDGESLRTLMALHTAASDYERRTPVIARAQAAHLLAALRDSLQQAATGKPVAGAPGRVTDKLLFLVGHDTNLSNIAGALNLNWIIDGRADDTPPGGALEVELWRAADGTANVRLYYTAQTLEQMRNATQLTLQSPPQRVLVFVPDCSRKDGSCSLDAFLKLLPATFTNK